MGYDALAEPLLRDRCEALLGTVDDGHDSTKEVDGARHREPGTWALPKSGSSTTPPPMPTPCTSMKWSLKWSTARVW